MHDLSDRSLKERVIGATVLVLFMVIVVPIFLDGPSREEEITSVPVTLPGQNNQERRQQTIVLERDRREPVPTSTIPTQTDWVPELKHKQSAVLESPIDRNPAESELSSPTLLDTESTTGMWVVQLGSFSSKENADRLAAELRSDGFAAFLSELQAESGILQRVRVGPQENRESANSIANQLAKVGHEVTVVPHP